MSLVSNISDQEREPRSLPALQTGSALSHSSPSHPVGRSRPTSPTPHCVNWFVVHTECLCQCDQPQLACEPGRHSLREKSHTASHHVSFPAGMLSPQKDQCMTPSRPSFLCVRSEKDAVCRLNYVESRRVSAIRYNKAKAY